VLIDQVLLALNWFTETSAAAQLRGAPEGCF